MIDDSPRMLMFIEPKNQPTGPVDDGWTLIAEYLKSIMKPSGYGCRGFHVCVCGQCSDNRDWYLPGGFQTHSLLLHYVRDHRDEVPESELAKVHEASLAANVMFSLPIQEYYQ